MLLLDTNVLSETRKPRPNFNVMAWLSRQPGEQLFLSTVTIAEILYGIAQRSATPDRQHLREWLDAKIRPTFDGRVLPLSEYVLLRWRILLEGGRKSGRTYSQPDLFLAVTALEHALTLVTRNTRDFADIPGLQLLDPWEPQP